MRALGLMLLIALYGCAPYKNIDPKLRQYYNVFIYEGTSRHTDLNHEGINISFSSNLGRNEKNETILGMCSWDPLHEVPWVTVAINDFDALSESQKEELMFHEFGHCLLGLDHDDALLPTGKAKSVMNSHLFRGNDYFDNRQYYVDELFLLD